MSTQNKCTILYAKQLQTVSKVKFLKQNKFVRSISVAEHEFAACEICTHQNILSIQITDTFSVQLAKQFQGVLNLFFQMSQFQHTSITIHTHLVIYITISTFTSVRPYGVVVVVVVTSRHVTLLKFQFLQSIHKMSVIKVI